MEKKVRQMKFRFFRLDKCERWEQLLCWCFETLIVCPCLLIANTTLLAFKTLLFLFFPKSALPNWECGLSTDAAYTWTFTVSPFATFLSGTGILPRNRHGAHIVLPLPIRLLGVDDPCAR